MSDSNVSRRKFFIHSAHKTIGVSSGLAALQACDLSQFAVADDAPRPLRVCLVSGSTMFESDRSLDVLEEHLLRHYRIKCSRASAESKDGLPGLEQLEEADCMVLFARPVKIDGEQLERIKRYCHLGGAIVAVRTTSHAMQNWLEFDTEVLSGDYTSDYGGDYGNNITEVKIAEAAKDHPVLAGVEPFASHGMLHENTDIAEDATVLLNSSFTGHQQPVAWVRRHHGGRVFYTSLGHPDDFRQQSFLHLLSNAMHWTCG